MGQTGREELFFKILIFFAVFTAIAGILNVASSGTITIKDMGSAVSGGSQGSIPGQVVVVEGATSAYFEGADTGVGAVLGGIDFTTASSINQNVTSLLKGTWTLVPGKGLVLTALNWWPTVFPQNVILIKNIQSVGGVYTVNTKVDNSEAGGDFWITPRWMQDAASTQSLIVVFSSDGVHIKNPLSWGLTDSGDYYFYPLPGASTTISGGSTITTVLTEVVSAGSNVDYTSTLTISKDGTVLFTKNVVSIVQGLQVKIIHGGAGSNNVNFIIQGFPSTSILDNSVQSLSGPATLTTDPLSILGNFLGLIGAILGLTNQSVVPFWLWCIVGLPCIAVLTLIGIEILRGV
jgi:hypothetical protein